jgi:hypothetical protein
MFPDGKTAGRPRDIVGDHTCRVLFGGMLELWAKQAAFRHENVDRLLMCIASWYPYVALGSAAYYLHSRNPG